MQWSQVLKSWLKKAAQLIEDWRRTWSIRHQPNQHRVHIQQHTNPSRARHKTQALMLFSALAMASTAITDLYQTQFDTDSGPVGIDNRCSACISNCIEDFIDTPRQSSRVIKGFGGTTTTQVQLGTIQWKWEDDNGMVHDHTIPNSYFVPEGGIHLLSPQHWMQSTMSNKEKQRHSSQCITYHDHVVLMWKDKYQLTIPLDARNVGTFPPGTQLLQIPSILCRS